MNATPVFGVTPSVEFLGQFNRFENTYAGSTLGVFIKNVDNTNTSSDALVSVRAGGSSGGNPVYDLVIESVCSYSFKIDNADSDSYKITKDTTLISKSTSAGEWTQPLQPAFLAILPSDIAYITGDATSYTLICTTEEFDQNSDYNNTTGYFTTPVTGRYYFSASCLIKDIGSGHTHGEIRLMTSNRNYRGGVINIGACRSTSTLVDNLNMNLSLLVDMDAGDTAHIEIQASGSTKTVGLNGVTDYPTNYFSGKLEC